MKMDALGICLETDDASLNDAVHLLFERLETWHIAGTKAGCQLTLRLSLGPPGITYSSTDLRSLVANLAHVTDLPPRRSWMGSNPDVIGLQFSRGFVPSSTLLGQIAWVLFLWAASNHIDHETFAPLYAGDSEASGRPVRATPRSTPPVSVTHATVVTNPLAKTHRSPHPGLSPMNPPPAKAKPSGG
ncbi:MAG: hypothetical protein OWU33_16040 [Firmicutes bacterium]|nr:hypothetical protein [Bacillota bacterium]